MYVYMYVLQSCLYVFFRRLGPPPARPTAPKPGDGPSSKASPAIDPVLLQSLNLNEFDLDPKLIPGLLDPRHAPPAALLDPKFNPPPDLLAPRAPAGSAPDVSSPTVDPRVQALREATLAAMGGGGADYSQKPVARGYRAAAAVSSVNTIPGAPAVQPAAEFKPKPSVMKPPAKPPAPSPGGPTLADYLPFMKPKTFGDQKAGK